MVRNAVVVCCFSQAWYHLITNPWKKAAEHQSQSHKEKIDIRDYLSSVSNRDMFHQLKSTKTSHKWTQWTCAHGGTKRVYSSHNLTVSLWTSRYIWGFWWRNICVSSILCPLHHNRCCRKLTLWQLTFCSRLQHHLLLTTNYNIALLVQDLGKWNR